MGRGCIGGMKVGLLGMYSIQKFKTTNPGLNQPGVCIKSVKENNVVFHLEQGVATPCYQAIVSVCP